MISILESVISKLPTISSFYLYFFRYSQNRNNRWFTIDIFLSLFQSSTSNDNNEVVFQASSDFVFSFLYETNPPLFPTWYFEWAHSSQSHLDVNWTFSFLKYKHWAKWAKYYKLNLFLLIFTVLRIFFLGIAQSTLEHNTYNVNEKREANMYLMLG